MRNQIMLQTSDEQFAKIVSDATNYADICRVLNLRLQGSNYGTIKRRIFRQQLSTSHFNADYIKKTTFKNTIPLERILVENSTYLSSNTLKERLIKQNILQNKCYKCNLENVWQNEPITLQLDHINGNHRDNRIGNLRIACPNCHSQTSTHSGKRFKKIYYCPSCNSTYAGYGMICIKCSSKQSKIYFDNPSINWPEDKLLAKMVWDAPLLQLSKKIKCSFNGLKMRCHKIGVSLPPQGYWQRIAAGHSPEQSLKKTVKSIRTPMRKWTMTERKEMVTLQKEGLNTREIGRKFHVAHTTIARQIRNYEKIGGSEGSRTLS